MPLDNDQIPALCLRWAKGDPAAADFLVNVCAWVRLADDLADGDSDRPQEDVGQLLTRLVVDHAANRFFRAHADMLTASVANAIIGWRMSETWRRSPNRKTRMFAFVLREGVGQIAWTVALIVGGYDHALAVAADIHERSIEASEETFEAWEQEE